MRNDLLEEIVLDENGNQQTAYERLMKQMDNPRRKDEDWDKKPSKKKKTLRSHRRGR